MTRARILIVDDLPEKRLVYSSLLDDLNAEIVSASSGTEALKRVLESSYAVILLDVNMPDLDGLETARLIRSHRNGAQTPIIFVTSYADESQMARAYELGAVDFILSPVVAPALRTKVKFFVALYEAHEALSRSNRELESRVRVRTAELEQLSRLKDEFLATMSHELRTPLNAIFGWVTLLRTRRLDEPTQERALETIERNARAQKRLIDDLLDVSRIVTGQVTLELVALELGRPVRAAIETVRPAVEAKGLTLAPLLGTKIGAVRGDSARLQQIVSNLLSNAVKFTPSGGRIDVILDSRDGFAELTVSDSGQGIKPEFLPLVFEVFRQEDGSISRRHAGLGLGLAIVRHLVELHGGAVAAYSDGEGKGARFVVRLPLSAATEPAQPSDPLSAPAASSRLTGARLLVVDDEPTARDLIASILRGYGAEVSVAEGGQAALTRLVDERPQVLIADLGMPDMDGYALIEQVRALEPDFGGLTPAVAVTAHTSPVHRLRALQAGYQNHVAKPVEPEELAIVISSLIRRPGSPPPS